MKKILVSANLDLFFAKFLFPHLQYLKEQGYEVHVACKNTGIEIPYCDKRFDVSFARDFNIRDNITSYKQMKQILKDNDYDIIHCHTPFGAAITRLAYRKVKHKAKMIYTAHGFHFFKGASFKNWLILYPAEKIMARWTDVVITINEEDYEIASRKFKTEVRYIHGIGLDKNKFKKKLTKQEKKKLRESLGLKDNDFVMIYGAELSKRKGQSWLLTTMQPLLKQYPNMKLLLPGNDVLNGECQQLAEQLNIASQVQFLGFRKDMGELLQIANLALSSSYQEGLPVNIMEAVYYHLPLVVTDCRGNKDFIEEGINGYAIVDHNADDFRKKVELFYHHIDTEKIAKCDEKLIQPFFIDRVLTEMEIIYKEVGTSHE